MSNWAAFMAKAKGPTKAKPHANASSNSEPRSRDSPKKDAKDAAKVHAVVQPKDNGPHSAVTVLDMLDLRERTASDVSIRTGAPRAAVGRVAAWIEATRLLAVRQLGELFRERCDELGGRKHFAHFETWLWAARGESGDLDGVVPPIPLPHASSSARAELARKLVRAGVDEERAKATCDELDARCASLIERVERETAHVNKPHPAVRLLSLTQESARPETDSAAAEGKGGKKRKRGVGDGGAGGGGGADGSSRTQPSDSDGEELRRVRLNCGDVEVIVTQHHLDKLRRLYTYTARTGEAAGNREEAKNSGGKKKKSKQRTEVASSGVGASSSTADGADDDDTFLDAAFSVLARLMSLQGGHDNAGGMQGACPPAVFDTLRADFGVTMECFASPLNARFPRFCSASADVDAPFGSRGSFFALRPETGAFLANPPFEPGIVGSMAGHMEAMLVAADARGGSLLFVVVIPAWPDQPCWQALQSSPHCASTLRLPKSKHAYLDGGQHHGRRAVPLRLSNHDSSVFFLMSAHARTLSPLTFNKERRLREAFTGGLKVLGALHK